MKIVIYGLTITSSWGNGHATTYRSLVKALARRGHQVLFVEKDVEWYRSNRDLPKPDFCTVWLYGEWGESGKDLVALSADADVIVVGSYFPDAIDATRRLTEGSFAPILFYDIDTPVTVATLRAQGRAEYLDPSLLPAYSAYLSFTGGPTLQELETVYGATWAVPFYCSVDSDLYHPVARRPEYQCDLSYLGTYAKDRQAKLMEYLNAPAAAVPDGRFIVAGPQYPEGTEWQKNVKRMIHLAPPEHPAFYSSSRFSLNLTRADMVAAGYSPSVRLFEASACGATILSDSWAGLDEFLTPGEEVLLPQNAGEVLQILTEMSEEERERVGRQARARILDQHTSEHRAAEFEAITARCYAKQA